MEKIEHKALIGPRSQYKLVAEIKSRRKELGLTQEELATRCNYKQQTIQRIEGGKFAPNLKTLQIIAEALDAELTLIPKNE